MQQYQAAEQHANDAESKLKELRDRMVQDSQSAERLAAELETSMNQAYVTPAKPMLQ